MNRRSAILLGFTVATGVLLIPSCMQPKSKSYPRLKNISVSEEQAKLLELLAAAIIPETTTPGAVKTGAPDFILRMVDDCYDPETVQNLFPAFLNLNPSQIKDMAIHLLHAASHKEMSC